MGFDKIVSFKPGPEEEKKGERFDFQDFNVTNKVDVRHPYDEVKLHQFI
jgi:hypothetical protein